MKKFFIIGIPVIIILVSAAVIFFRFVFDEGPRNTEKHTLVTAECKNNVKVEIYRKKQANLTTTNIGISIEKDNRSILSEKLNSADMWSDLTDSDIKLECDENKIETSLKYYFERVYIFNNDGSITKRNNLSN